MGEEVAFFLIVAVCGLLYLRHRWHGRRWRVRIHTFRGVTRVDVCRGLYGSPESSSITMIKVMDPEYELKLSQAESDAYDKCAALNNSERVNRRKR